MLHGSRKNKGFTLVELLITLGCLIALSAAVYPTASHFMALSKSSAAKNGAAAIATAINQFKYELDQYPDSLTDLTNSYGQYGPWVSTSTLKDPWNTDYYYVFDADAGTFAVWSGGQNGINETGTNVPNEFRGDDIGIIQ